MDLLARPKNFVIALLAICSIAFAATAADAKTETKTTTTTSNSVKADNTGKNERDVTRDTLTPEDQAKGSDADVEMTRRLRAQLVQKDTLSTYAQNVKIITLNGVVTLRGPVKTLNEKNQIGAIAKTVAGSTANVRNELEIAR